MICKRNLIIVLVLTIAVYTGYSGTLNTAPGPVSRLSAAPVLHWNEIAYEAFGGKHYQHSLMASRINAMTQLAVHDALNSIEEKYARYAFFEKDRNADPEAAVASAAYHVLVNEIPERKVFLDSAYEDALMRIPNNHKKQKGIAIGTKAAMAILALRAEDGSKANPIEPIEKSDRPGIYQAVPPFDFKFATFWQNVKAFSLEKKEQFRIAPFPSINSREYADAYNEVKAFGSLNSKVRTGDQTFFAKFWYEFSEAGWNRVARIAIVNRNIKMLDAARILALVNIAIADAYIAGWDSKIHYDFWRPYTAIRLAEKDGNINTLPDSTWEPCETTPPIHDYPSTHSALGSAAATVLAKMLGDNTSFTMTSPTAVPEGSTRSFKSFSQAAKENAESRIMAGIHFRFSCEAGLKLGEDVGNLVVDKFLKPLR